MPLRPHAATHRLESAIASALVGGLTYAAIAVELGTTRRVVEWTAARLGIRRPPGRPRLTAPRVIPSRSSPALRW